MQYFIMFILCVLAALTDVITGLLKARATIGYDSTILRQGLYRKAINLAVMLFFIAVDIGFEWLGSYYSQEALGRWTGGISAIFVFLIIMLMEGISITENFAEANPKSAIAKAFARYLRKLGKKLTEVEEQKKEVEENGSSST